MLQKKPRVFIGSSSENLEKAKTIQAILDIQCEPVIWSQNIFKLSQFNLESLIEELDRSDFAIFAFTPDDNITIRGEKKQAVRDNVIFELGLFIGKIGRQCCFLLVPKNQKGLHLPSDLLGINTASYDSERSDGNLEAAITPACQKILLQINKIGLRTAENRPRLFEYFQDGRISMETIIKILQSAKKEIFIVGSSLRTFVLSFEQIQDNKFKNHVIDLLKRGVSIKFLLMDPDSKTAQDFALDMEDLNLLDQTRNSINTLKLLASEFDSMKLKTKIGVSLYNQIPTAYIVLIDPTQDYGTGIYSHYLPAIKKAHSPSIKISRAESPLAFERYYNAVQQMLKRAKKII